MPLTYQAPAHCAMCGSTHAFHESNGFPFKHFSYWCENCGQTTYSPQAEESYRWYPDGTYWTGAEIIAPDGTKYKCRRNVPERLRLPKYTGSIRNKGIPAVATTVTPVAVPVRVQPVAAPAPNRAVPSPEPLRPGTYASPSRAFEPRAPKQPRNWHLDIMIPLAVLAAIVAWGLRGAGYF